MTVICLQNFRCNGVIGGPGKVLTVEDLERIGEFVSHLSTSGLVRVDDQPAPPVTPTEAITKPAKGKRRR